MKTFVISVFSILSLLCAMTGFSQSELRIQYKPDKKTFVKTKTKGLRIKETYTVQILGGHNGLFDTKVKVNDLNQSSSTPEILKFLGISSTVDMEGLVAKGAVTDSSYLSRLSIAEENVLKILDRFLEASVEEYETAFSRWRKETTYHIENDLKCIKDLTRHLDNPNNKQEALDVLRATISHAQVMKDLIAMMLKNRKLETIPDDVISDYSSFLAQYDITTANVGKYQNAIRFVYDFIQHPRSYLKDGVGEEEYYDFFEAEAFSSEGDKVEVRIDLVSKLSRDTVYTQTLDYFTYGKWKFDFSTGFYYNTLRNDSYSVVGYSGDSSSVTLKQDYRRQDDIAIGAQLHFTYKIRPALGIGVNLGSAVSPFDGTAKYLLGGHVSLGHAKQLMLSAGLAFGKVKRVSRTIAYTQPGPEDEIVVAAVHKEPKLVDQYKTSLFIGLSYNLSSVFKPVRKQGFK